MDDDRRRDWREILKEEDGAFMFEAFGFLFHTYFYVTWRDLCRYDVIFLL